MDITWKGETHGIFPSTKYELNMTDEMNYREYWDKILHATWDHNPYLEIVTEILYKKYPVEDHEDHSDLWADPVVKSESEMRELIEKMENYWKDKIKMLMETIDVLSEDLVFIRGKLWVQQKNHAASIIKDSAWIKRDIDWFMHATKEN